MAFLDLSFKWIQQKTPEAMSPSEVIGGRVHWTETNLAMRSKPQDTVSMTTRDFEPQAAIN